MVIILRFGLVPALALSCLPARGYVCWEYKSE
jgi:hypothetical protein